MDVCLPVCKVGFSVCRPAAGRKRCGLHVSRSANCDTQFANWYGLQIRCASSATSLQTELLRPTVCKLRPDMQTVLRSHPVCKLDSVCRLSQCADCAQHIQYSVCDTSWREIRDWMGSTDRIQLFSWEENAGLLYNACEKG